MDIFEKGNYLPVPADFRTLGIVSLKELSIFQEKYEMYDTDTTINTIRDAIVANYLNFDLLNFDKHGFDAKKSSKDQFLEVKQCSISSKSLGGTWNDTSEDKARAFSDDRLFTVVAVWKGASDLQFMVYGQCEDLGEHLLERVQNKKIGAIFIDILTLVKVFNFKIICSIDKSISYLIQLLVGYNREFASLMANENIFILNQKYV